ncbi:MAG: glycosyltransferase [bacterium]|nr:glycosyltransferase [bacterium]
MGAQAPTTIGLTSLPEDFWNAMEAGAILIIQRLPLNKRLKKFLKEVGKTAATIVYDIDDQIFDPNELEDWRASKLPAAPRAYAKCMAYADFFLVSTAQLRSKIERRFQRPAYIIQNCLSQEIVHRSAVAAEMPRPTKFVIGYAAGSPTHDADLDAALPAITKFMRQNPHTEFHCIGHVSLPRSIVDEFADRIVQRGAVPWSELPKELAKHTLQIIPLADCPFNRYKSHIRFLEAAAAGVPTVVSSVGEQSLTVSDGNTGLICENTIDAWHTALQTLYDRPELRARIADRASQFVRRYYTTRSGLLKHRLCVAFDDFEIGCCRESISIILVTYNPLVDVKTTIDSVLNSANQPFELLIWNNSISKEIVDYFQELKQENLMLFEFGKNVGKAAGANQLFRNATGRYVCGLDDDYTLPKYWDIQMIQSARAVPNLGWLSTNLTEDSSGMRNRGVRHTHKGGISTLYPPGVGGWVMFTTASARQKIGFYKEHGLYGGIDGDYNRRARRLGLYTGYVRQVVGVHKSNRSSNLAWELFKQRIQDGMRIHGKDSDTISDKFVDYFNERSSSLSIAIKICTSTTHDENVWGDTHFGRSLKTALEKKNYDVRIDKHEHWYDPNNENTDIVIHLFGIHKYDCDESAINLLWIISHPDKIDSDFLYQFDHIFCAADKVLDRVRSLAPGIRAEVLPQCTDVSIFYPDDSVIRDLDLVFVGNSRRIYRNSVKFAVSGGHEVTVWGTKWDAFIDKKYIQGEALVSEDVAEIYRRAKIVLNDHWNDQIETGLVNNRVLDAAACEAIVLSDRNPGLDELLGVEVAVFDDAESFESTLSEIRAAPDVWQNRARALGDVVRKRHTFDDRAACISAAIEKLIADYVTYKSEHLWKLRRRRQEDPEIRNMDQLQRK